MYKFKLFGLLLTVGMVVTSCSNEDDILTLEPTQKNNVRVVCIKNGKVVLNSRAEDPNAGNGFCFEDDKDLKEFGDSLKNLSDEQRLEFINKTRVRTLHNLAIEASDELDSLANCAISEEDFRLKYSAHINKYKNKLITNNVDDTDLDLYVPDGDNVLSYIGNEDGYYVVGDEVRQYKPELVLTDDVKDLSILAKNPAPSKVYTNSYVVSPDSKKRVYFSIARKYDTVRITMYAKKRVWYGWKDDKDRELVFEPHFTGVSCVWFIPLYGRYYCKSSHKRDILRITGGRYLRGTIDTWTDLDYERDRFGKIVFEHCYNLYAPKCPYTKSTVVNVFL